MKSVLAALAFIAVIPAQAQIEQIAFDCWSLNSANSYTVTIGQEKTMSNPWGPPSRYYPVQVVDSNTGETVITFKGTGELTDWTADLSLVRGVGAIVGTVKVNLAFDHFTGTLETSEPDGGLQLEMACSR